MRISDWSSDVCSSDLSIIRASFHAASALKLARMIEAMERLPAMSAVDLEGYDRLLKMRDRETKAIGDKATKLRLTNQSRYTPRSEEHTSELQSLMRISYAVLCLKKKK